MIMILLEEALEILDKHSNIELQKESIDIDDACGRVLAQDVLSDMDFPSFDKSAMDGYAIRKEDIEKELIVIEFIGAGKKPENIIQNGQCAQIMTGAMVPEGADMVVMQEDVTRDDNKIIITNTKSKSNILKQGEDVKVGELLLETGLLLNPIHIGLMASVGCVNPLVFKKSVISIISTGSELVDPSVKPIIPQIRNSNSSQLKAIAKRIGC